jgi:hypothetical protein
LVFEAHNNEERTKLVWLPTQKFLEDFASTQPSQVNCFFGKLYNFPKKPGCFCQDIFVINEQHYVAYLGTVFNQQAMITDRNRIMLNEKAKVLSKIGFAKIIRDKVFCIIPSDKKEITQDVRFDAVKRYFLSYKKNPLVLSLAGKPIGWLSAKNGRQLSDRIIREAKRTAKKPTEEEFKEKFLDDEM